MNITLGRNHQINCDEKDLYKFIGYLANHPNDVNLVFEKIVCKVLGVMRDVYSFSQVKHKIFLCH